jgi:hypothetical protein
MITVAMGKDVMTFKTVATEGHSSDKQISDIMDEPL